MSEKSNAYWKDIAAFKEYVTNEIKLIDQEAHATSWREANWTWKDCLSAPAAAKAILKHREMRKRKPKYLWDTP